MSFNLYDILTKPSTWTGLFGLLAALGIVVAPELAAQITAAGLGLVGVINLLKKEKSVP